MSSTHKLRSDSRYLRRITKRVPQPSCDCGLLRTHDDVIVVRDVEHGGHLLSQIFDLQTPIGSCVAKVLGCNRGNE